MIMPAASLVLPIFLELNSLHLIGTCWLGDPAVLVLPVRGEPRLHLLLDGRAARAARRGAVDGCGEWETFRHIALPLAKPVVALVLFFSFVADWNNFFLPYTVLADSRQYPIQVGLSTLLSSTPSFNPATGGGGQAGHLPARARPRHAARGDPRRDRLHAVAALAGARPGRRRGEGVGEEAPDRRCAPALLGPRTRGHAPDDGRGHRDPAHVRPGRARAAAASRPASRRRCWCRPRAATRIRTRCSRTGRCTTGSAAVRIPRPSC